MNYTYDIFELRPDGVIWRAAVTGLQEATAVLEKLASQSPDEFQLMYLPTNTLIASSRGRAAHAG
jgi:hypothetical protein